MAPGEEGGRRLEVGTGDAEPVDVDDRVRRRTGVRADTVVHREPVDDDPLRLQWGHGQSGHPSMIGVGATGT